jgi:hypothetical protein
MKTRVVKQTICVGSLDSHKKFKNYDFFAFDIEIGTEYKGGCSNTPSV